MGIDPGAINPITAVVETHYDYRNSRGMSGKPQAVVYSRARYEQEGFIHASRQRIAHWQSGDPEYSTICNGLAANSTKSASEANILVRFSHAWSTRSNAGLLNSC